MAFRIDAGTKQVSSRSTIRGTLDAAVTRPLLWSGLALSLALGACSSSQTPAAQTAAGEGVTSPGAPPVDLSQCDEKGKQVVTSDTNNDKKPDVWKLYASGGSNAQILTC